MEGLAFTYENMMKTVDSLPTGGEPLTVDEMGALCSLKVDPNQEQGRIATRLGHTSNSDSHLQVACHPADEEWVKTQLLGALFQVHRERYGGYGEE